MQFEEALRLAVRWLGYRDRPAGEIRRKLRERGADEETVARVIEYLRARGWLDDAAWAERWIASRAQRGWGRQHLIAGLVQRGFSRAKAEELVSRLVDLQSEVEQGLKVLRRKWRQVGGGWPQAASWLQRRGFSGESLTVLRNRLAEAGGADLDNQEEGE